MPEPTDPPQPPQPPPSSGRGAPTDDVSGAARAAEGADGPPAEDAADAIGADSAESEGADATAREPAPEQVAELAAACVRFVGARYNAALDFTSDTLSLVDQWLRDARAEVAVRPEATHLVEAAAGAYLGEVIRLAFGGSWAADGPMTAWRLRLSTVYCSFNPVGMAREALTLQGEPDYGAHFELDPGEREAVEERLEALPRVREEDYYAPSMRFDAVETVVHALRARMRAAGLDDVRFGPEDY
jgi:hypothetical protein